MTRVTVPVGEDIGFLPGTEEEKMTPWMGALMDNLEVLTQTEGGDWGRAATVDLLRSRIRIHSLNFMRGPQQAHHRRGFLNPRRPRQVLSSCDSPYLTETTSGLTYVVKTLSPSGPQRTPPCCAATLPDSLRTPL